MWHAKPYGKGVLHLWTYDKEYWNERLHMSIVATNMNLKYIELNIFEECLYNPRTTTEYIFDVTYLVMSSYYH